MPERRSRSRNRSPASPIWRTRLALEVVPQIELADFKQHQARAAGGRSDRGRGRRGGQRSPSRTKPYNPKGEGAKIETGDRAIINFTGKIDRRTVRGRRGRGCRGDCRLRDLHPGLRGADHRHGGGRDPARERDVSRRNYPSQQLAGKDAEFEVTVKSIETARHGARSTRNSPSRSAWNRSPSCARRSRSGSRGSTRRSRQKLKRELLDELDNCTSSAAARPWSRRSSRTSGSRCEHELKTRRSTFADEGTTEEKAKAEYRAIAERRVRLGLVLAEIGEKNKISVTDEEMNRARHGARRASFPARSRRCGTITARTRRRSPACGRRSSRKRWSTSCSSSPTVTEKKVAREELYKDDGESARLNALPRLAVGRISQIDHADAALRLI